MKHHKDTPLLDMIVALHQSLKGMAGTNALGYFGFMADEEYKTVL